MSKLRFHVCFASSEDPEYPASELNTHSPHTRGWQSPQFADAPQELGLELAAPACLTQVQILSHQSKIATRIELFIGEGDSYEEAHFQRLGYLSLNSNERSHFQARELKSVYIDGPGRFLRLLVHKCYINELNLFNQVGIIAINLLGDPLPPADADAAGAVAATSTKASAPRLPPTAPERAITGRRPLPLSAFASAGGGGGGRAGGALGVADLPGGAPGARRRRSEMDDLSFDMNFDPETARRIRDIAAAKERAVAGEDYDAAKRLKQAEVALKGLGTRLSQLEISKRDAVDEEDYDRAKELKGEIEALRGQIEAQVAAGEFQLQGLRAGPSSNGVPIDPPRQPHRGYAFGTGEGNGGGGGGGGGSVGGGSIGGSVGGGRGGRSLTPHDEVPVGTKQADGGIGNISGTGGGAGGEYGGYGSDGTGGGTITPPGDWGNGGGAGIGGLGSGGSALNSPSPPGGGVAGRRPPASQQASPARGGEDEEASLGSMRPPGGLGGSGRQAGRTEVFPAGQHPLEGVPGLEDLPDPEPLSARVDLSEVQGLNALLGDYVARSLYSKAWALREAATLKVRQRLPELAKEPGLEAALPVLAQILRLGAEDKIAQVFLTAMALLHEVLEAAAAERAVRHNVLVTQLEPVVATLLLKLGDGQGRVRDGAMDGLLAIARCRAAGAAFVGHMGTKPLPRKQATAWRPLQARLQLLTALIKDFGASSGGGGSGGGGLSADGVMGFAKSCDAFAHSNAQVRDAARELAVAVYKHVGDDVERHLGSLRPKQLEEYRQAFREAGGPAGSGPAGGGGGGRRKSAESTGSGAAAAASGGDDRARARGAAAGGTAAAREADGGPKTARGGGGGGGAASSGAGGAGSGAGGGSKARAAAARSPSPTRHGQHAEGHGGGGGGNRNNGGGSRAPASVVPGEDDDYSDGGGEAGAGGGRADLAEGDDGFDANHTCQFCGDYDEGYNEDELDLHYWRDCPMLVPCPECEVVVEIVVLRDHLLEECHGRDNYRVCNISGMAIRRDGMAAWQSSKACRRPGRLGPSARCPLCFVDVAELADEEGWRDHLIGVCVNNERRVR